VSFAENSQSPPSVERLGVEELPPTSVPRRRSTEKPPAFRLIEEETAPAPAMRHDDLERISRTVEAFRALGWALSARALLLLALIGAFVLATLASLHESQATLEVLVAWCLLTIGPITFLEVRRRTN
jgi:hypothetical protein